ncbi:hypothetical protein Droror1_Dr00014966 [Drosera rotundifolia]
MDHLDQHRCLLGRWSSETMQVPSPCISHSHKFNSTIEGQPLNKFQEEETSEKTFLLRQKSSIHRDSHQSSSNLLMFADFSWVNMQSTSLTDSIDFSRVTFSRYGLLIKTCDPSKYRPPSPR